MRMFRRFISSLTFLYAASSPLLAADITNEIPELKVQVNGFIKVADVAQYKEADWNNVVGIARNISLSDAREIANSHPEITFFFYTKGYQMVLETTEGNYRVFHHGDTVFFTGSPWWGSAPGLADGYIKEEYELY